MNGASTKTDVSTCEWSVDDNVMRFREWASDVIAMLPPPPINQCTLGSADTCSVQIDDPSGRVSRLHAYLIRDASRWWLRDVGSKNGVTVDGARRSEIVLAPGIEIGIGGVTLIAESPRSVALRGFLARLLGWRSHRTEAVDHALRSVRLAATRRFALVLCGEGDLVPIAQSLHRRALGTDRPFVLCDPRRLPGKATVRSAANYETGMEALAAAAGGSLCVRSRRLPRDFLKVVTALRDPGARAQLVVCSRDPEECAQFLAPPIVIPPLSRRPGEIDQIINEFAEDAIAQLAPLGGSRTGFLPVDRAWVRTYSATSLPDIEKATLRLVAIRESRNLSNAAARLGMAPVSLSRWIGRRSLPMEVEP